MSVDSDAVPVTRLLVQTGPDAPKPDAPNRPPRGGDAPNPDASHLCGTGAVESTESVTPVGDSGPADIRTSDIRTPDIRAVVDAGACTGEIDTRTGEFFTRMNSRARPSATTAGAARLADEVGHRTRDTRAAHRRRSTESVVCDPGTTIPILERLTRMAVSAHRVTDPMSVPGEIVIDLADSWQTAQSPGCLRLFVAGHGSEGTIAIVLTRFVVDHHTDLTALLDHAPVEARGLPDWVEDDVVTSPRGFRTEGASLQTGTYLDSGERRFCALRYEVFARGNVAYLVHTTGLVPLREGREFCSEVVTAVCSVGLDD